MVGQSRFALWGTFPIDYSVGFWGAQNANQDVYWSGALVDSPVRWGIPRLDGGSPGYRARMVDPPVAGFYFLYYFCNTDNDYALSNLVL